MTRRRILALFPLMIMSVVPLLGQENERPMAPFGFSGIEFFKTDRGVDDLLCRDMNGDGLKDLLVVNNAKATIEILLQRSPAEMKKAAEERSAGKNVNEIPNDGRFRREKIVTEKHLFAIAVDDFNNDKFSDIAFFGDPPELVVVPGSKEGWSGDRTTIPLSVAASERCALAAADFNGDGATDLALLGERETWLFFQDGKGKFLPTVRFPNHEKDIAAMWACDLNGDKRKDLIYVNPASPRPIAVRFQEKGGLGDIVTMKLPSVDMIDTSDVDGDGTDEIVAIASTTGRLNIYRWERKTEAAAPFSIRMIPSREQAGSRRGATVIGDLTGDGLPEIVTLRPESAQIEMIRHGGKNATVEETFPTLAEARSAALADCDGDGRREMVIASAKEKVVGVMRWGTSGLSFPVTAAVEEKVLALAAGKILGGKSDDVLLLTQSGDGSLLRIVTIDPASGVLKERHRLAIDKAVPDRARVFDVNQDGKEDILLFVPYEPMIVLLNVGKETATPVFENLSAKNGFQSGLVNEARYASFASADVNGDRLEEFLLAKKNFVRAMAVDAAGKIDVRRQFNVQPSTHTVAASVAVDVDGDRIPEIALLDETENKLQILKLTKSGTETLFSIDVGMIKTEELAAADMDGDGKSEIILIAESGVVILRQGEGEDRLVAIGHYESEHRDGVLGGFACGDLNGDGRRDIVVVEESENGVSIVVPTKSKAGDIACTKALGFKVYEGRSFRRGGDDQYLAEPREMVVDDVTGDGKNDLILLIHDRILVYPQE